MKIQIPDAKVDAGHVASVSIDEVVFSGDVTAAQLAVDNAQLTLLPEPIQVKGIVVELKVNVTLSLGPRTESFDFDRSSRPINVTLPAPPAPGLSLTVAQLAAQNLDLEVDDLSSITVGPVDATGIKLQETNAPSGGFQLTGLGVGAASISDLALPAADILETAIASVVANADIPSMVLSGIALPQGLGGDLELGGLNASPQLDAISFHVAGIGGITITPTLSIKIAQIVLPNVAVGVKIDKITIERLHAAFEARKVKISSISLQNLQVPTARIA